jgi:integrase
MTLSSRSVRYIHVTLHKALAQAATDDGAIPRNVAHNVKPPKLVRREMQVPSPGDLARFLDTARERDQRLWPLWTVAVYSGCRLGELLGLQWRDVDPAEKAIAIRRTLLTVHDLTPHYGEPKTAAGRRSVTLSGEAMAALHAQKARAAQDRLLAGGSYADTGLVFATGIGTPLIARNVQRDFKLALTRAGLPLSVRFHDLRHASATAMLAAGVHPKVASARLGHASVGITLDLYSHVVEGLDRDAADRIQTALRSAAQ